MKCLFIINPKAGINKVQRKLNQMIGQLILEQVLNQIDVFYTQKKNDAYQKCLSLKDYDLIISLVVMEQLMKLLVD